ncbi:hypothetical protein [Lacrimispora sp.]|uniref:hypothetical protein n=1 Tax=Lacrimispora sp. TaxID=2719234 RepID=UPI0039969CF6
MQYAIIQITILDKENIVKYISLIRGFTKEPIGEIKDNALKGKAIIECQYSKKPKELEQVYKVIKELRDKGAKIRIVQKLFGKMEREIDIEIVENLIQRNIDTSEEVKRIIDSEVGE